MPQQNYFQKKTIKGEVAILGGAGLIGSRVAIKLVALNYRVKILSRSSRNKKALAIPGISHHQINNFSEQSILYAIQGVDIVINTIGILHENRKYKQEFEDIHIKLVNNLCHAITQTNVKQFIHLSALKAHSAHAPSRYLKSKGIAEDLVKKICSNKVAYSIVQPSLVFSEDAQSIKVFSKIVQFMPFVIPLARAHSKFAPIHVDDLAQLIIQIINNPKASGRILQAYGPEVMTLKEIIKSIATAYHRRPLVLPLPYYLGWLQAFFLNYLIPGKLMTIDNFHSLSVKSVGEQSALNEFEIIPTSFSKWSASSLNKKIDLISNYRNVTK